MNFALIASLTLHAALIGWALVSFAKTDPLKTPTIEPVEVAIVTPDDLVRLKQGDRSSKNLETKAAESPEETKSEKEAARPVRRTASAPPPSAEPPPPPEPEKQETPPEPSKAEAQDPIADKLANLQPTPDPQAIALKKAKEAERKAAEEAKRKAAEEARKKAEAEAKRKAEEEAKRKAEAERKRKAEAERKRKAAEARKKKERERRERERKLAEKKKREQEAAKNKEFDAKIAALLNKVPDSAAPPAGSNRSTDRDLPRGPEAGAPEGRDDRLTSSQVAMISVMMKSAVKRCWNINSGLEGAEDLAVVVQIRLNPTGALDGQPRIMNERSDPYFRNAANSALRAIMQCAPYDLPEHLYKGGWDFMELSFDPRQMF